MAEYIERGTALMKLMQDGCSAKNLQSISDIPGSDVAPVVHGRWEPMHYDGGILDGTNFDKCSVCGHERVFEDENLKTAFVYCPKCGAKMDGVKNE